MKKTLLLLTLSIPLLSWDADPKLAPYMKKYLDSLSKQPGTFIVRRGDTTMVWYIEDQVTKKCTIITTPFHIKSGKQKETSLVNKNK